MIVRGKICSKTSCQVVVPPCLISLTLSSLIGKTAATYPTSVQSANQYLVASLQNKLLRFWEPSKNCRICTYFSMMNIIKISGYLLTFQQSSVKFHEEGHFSLKWCLCVKGAISGRFRLDGVDMKWKEKLRGPLFNQDKSEIKGLQSFYQEGGEILGETKPLLHDKGKMYPFWLPVLIGCEVHIIYTHTSLLNT